jgi:hypothetical protein
VVSELERYVRIDHFDPTSVTSRYQKMELWWPAELCRHSVDFVDTVGLDDPEARDQITLQHAKSADAILYCQKSHDTYSARDKEVLSMLQSLGYKAIFFVITYYDHIRESAMLGQTTEEKWRQLQEKNLTPWTELGPRGIKYVDSRSALMGRMAGNAALVEESGIHEIEVALEQFLAEEKGKAKLLTSLRSLRSVNRAVRKLVPVRIGMWRTSAAELEQRYRSAEVPLRMVETTRRLILTRVDAELRDVVRDAEDLIDAHLSDLPGCIQEWAGEYEFTTRVGLPPSRANLTAAVTELAEHLKHRITTGAATWTKDVLASMLNARIVEMRESIEQNARDFVNQVEQVRVEIAIGFDANEITTESDTPVWQRVVAGGLGVVFGDVVGVSMGIAFGLSALVRAVVVQLATAVALVAVGVANPWIGIPLVILSGTVVGGGWNILSLQKKIRSLVGTKLADSLRSQQEKLKAQLLDEVKSELAGLRRAIDAGLGGEIATLRREVEAVLSAHQSGQVDSAREIARLQDIDHRNHDIEKELDDFLLTEKLGL